MDEFSISFDSEDALQNAIAGTGIGGYDYHRDLIEHARSNSFVRVRVSGEPDRRLIWRTADDDPDVGKLELVEI